MGERMGEEERMGERMGEEERMGERMGEEERKETFSYYTVVVTTLPPSHT